MYLLVNTTRTGIDYKLFSSKLKATLEYENISNNPIKHYHEKVSLIKIEDNSSFEYTWDDGIIKGDIQIIREKRIYKPHIASPPLF